MNSVIGETVISVMTKVCQLVTVFDAITTNVGIRALAEKFQVGKTQIADIVSNTKEIYKAWVENGNEERKLTKLRKCEGNVINKEFLVYFSKTPEKSHCSLLSEYVLPIGIFHGNSKPKSIHEFFNPFLSDLLILLNCGLNVNGNIYQFEVGHVVCDSPAKSFLLNVKSFNAYFGCTSCT
ncbi:hypothetical protein QTP88_004811 [Uroleucon formosanum]